MLPSPTSEEGILGQELRDALEWSTFVVCILCNHFVLVRSIFWDWSLCLRLGSKGLHTKRGVGGRMCDKAQMVCS